jgi:hypothetical protein
MIWAATFDDRDSFLYWAAATDNTIPEFVIEETMMVKPPHQHGDRWYYEAWFKGGTSGVFIIPRIPFDLIRVVPVAAQLARVKRHLLPLNLYRFRYPGAMEAELAAFGIQWNLHLRQPFRASVPFWEESANDLMRWVQHGPILRQVRAAHFVEEADTVTYLEEIKAYADHVGTVNTKRWRLWQLEQAAYQGYITFHKMERDEASKRDIYYFKSTHPKFNK